VFFRRRSDGVGVETIFSLIGGIEHREIQETYAAAISVFLYKAICIILYAMKEKKWTGSDPTGMSQIVVDASVEGPERNLSFGDAGFEDAWSCWWSLQFIMIYL